MARGADDGGKSRPIRLTKRSMSGDTVDGSEGGIGWAPFLAAGLMAWATVDAGNAARCARVGGCVVVAGFSESGDCAAFAAVSSQANSKAKATIDGRAMRSIMT